MPAVGTPDFSIFQVEILSEDLKQHYKGSHLLEVWSKDGERILHKVLQSEISQWKVNDNVLIFKADRHSPVIHIVFLKERTITAINHPFGDDEVDMIFFDSLLIVAQQNNVRYVQISNRDAMTSIKSQNSGASDSQNDNQMPLLDKEFKGQVFHNIVGFVHHYLRRDLICVTSNHLHDLIYHKIRIQKEYHHDGSTTATGLEFELYQPAILDAKNRKSMKFDLKKVSKVDAAAFHHQVTQMHYTIHEGTPYLIVLRQNHLVEVVSNFSDRVLAESRVSIEKILPTFGGSVQFLQSDNNIVFSQTLDKFNTNREYLSSQQYYKQQALPAECSSQYEIHRRIQFYQDFLVVNQTLFLLRDNAIFLVNTFTSKVVDVFFPQQGYVGTKVMKLHRLRESKDDENGFKVNTFKVVAVQRNGSIQLFEPRDLNLQSEWKRTEINNTPMAQQQINNQPVQKSFQNPAAINYLYVVTVNN